MFIPTISASKVAALIGLNKFQDPAQTMYDVMTKDKHIKAMITEIEERARRMPLSRVKDEVMAHAAVQDTVRSAISACERTEDIASVLASTEASAKTLLDLRFPQYAEEVRTLLASEIRGQVCRQRGLKNENHILNRYENINQVHVTERNTKNLRKHYGKFVLIGRTDGWVASENRVVDSKDRTRFFPEPPIYDEIQMRVYMDMLGCGEAELIERFPDGSMRTTKFENDPARWASIQKAIEEAVAKMNDAVEKPDELKRIVMVNTVEIHGDSRRTSGAPRVLYQARLNI